MTDKLALHSKTKHAIDSLMRNPPQSVALVGPIGSGRGYLVTILAGELLQTTNVDKHPHYKRFDVSEGIEMVRELQRFVTLKVPDSISSKAVNRIAVIENADQLGTEAQNALLKTLEEPPAALLIIMTAAQTESLLPTIRSRTHIVSIHTPPVDELKQFLRASQFESSAVDQALRISAGLPGLTVALLQQDEKHPLYAATEQARAILRANTFERLAMVDAMAKQKEQTMHVLTMLSRMAQAALRQVAQSDATDANARMTSWEAILAAVNKTEIQLQANAQTKLTLTSLMLAL